MGRSLDQAGRSLSWRDVHAVITHCPPDSHVGKILDPDPERVWRPLGIQMQVALWNKIEHFEWIMRGAPKDYPPTDFRTQLKQAQQEAVEASRPRKTAADIRAQIAANEARERG